MATVPYVTRQSVREEAGFQHIEENSALVGVVDGSNAVFMTEHKPIVGKRYVDGSITTEDIVVYVDGSPVSVASLDAAAGVVTLASAPASDTSVSIFYHTSAVLDSYVDEIINQATSIVHRAFRSAGITTPFDSTNDDHEPYYASIQLIVKLYSAGLALIRDYGSNADTEETSKDGYKKLSTAKSELKKLLMDLEKDDRIGSAGNDGNGGTVSVVSSGRVFDNLDELEGGEREGMLSSSDSHDDFFRKP